MLVEGQMEQSHDRAKHLLAAVAFIPSLSLFLI
jgi:hypothetical protein